MIWKTAPRRHKLLLKYEGTNCSGWQKQKDGRTIQGNLQRSAERVLSEVALDIQKCGRTDAGVHSPAYAAYIEVGSEMEAETVAGRLNETHSKEIAVLQVESIHPRFHARHNCVSKSYIYQLKQRKSVLLKATAGGSAKPLMFQLCSVPGKWWLAA